jgi:hypothetical protein
LLAVYYIKYFFAHIFFFIPFVGIFSFISISCSYPSSTLYSTFSPYSLPLSQIFPAYDMG